MRHPLSGQRSGLLAAWSTAWLSGQAGFDDVIEAVVGDQLHRVAGLPDTTDPVPLGWALPVFRERGETCLRLVLPVPGDPRGLPGPGDFTTAALQCGQAVLGDTLGLVPEEALVETVGAPSAVQVTWRVYDVEPAPPDPLDLAQADHDLAIELRNAARTLSSLDVPRWHPDAAPLFEGMSNEAARRVLPPGHDQRAIGLLERAEQLSVVLDLAMADAPGGAVSGSEARARDEALRPLATAIRRAQVAAYAYPGTPETR